MFYYVHLFYLQQLCCLGILSSVAKNSSTSMKSVMKEPEGSLYSLAWFS